MRIAFNPSTVAALTAPPNNKDITFDLRGRNIFARGVKFQGTDTWRDIKINNVSIDSNILDLQNGSNTTLTNKDGVVTINSTWRPVVDNLTSDSTTSSLSANQGRVLAGLVKNHPQTIDMRNYDENYWHPVTVPLSQIGYNKIKVSVQLNIGDKPSWATHSSGFTCNMEIWATAHGWGTTNAETICLNYTYGHCNSNPCGWKQLGYPSLGVLFLRGGARYKVWTDFDATFTPHDKTYTWTGGGYTQSTGGPYTSCPGLDFIKNRIYANLEGSAYYLEGGNIPSWGTLTAANGFTNVSSYDYGSRGAYGLCGKNTALYMQLNGYFYQNEGKYRVIDTSDFNWTNLPSKIVAGNEFNIVNAGYSDNLAINYLPINNRNSSANISTYIMYNGNRGLASVYAKRFKVNGQGCTWKDARNYAPFYSTFNGGFEPILDIKTVSGDWSIGSYDSYGNHLVFAFTSDSDFNAGRNSTAQYYLTAGGEFKINTLRLAGSTNTNMGVGSTNPQIIFAEGSATQQVALTYTDWNSYRTSKGLKVHSYDGSDDDNVWFEVQGYNYSSGYVKNGSSNAYVLLGGGGHKPLSELGSGSYLPYNGWWSSESEQNVNNANGMIFAYATHKNSPFSSAWGIITTFDYTYDSAYKFQLAANGYSNAMYYRSRSDNRGGWTNWAQVIDTGNISSQRVAYATSAGSVAWANVTGKPSSFTPSTHDHNYVLDIANNTHTTFAYSKSGLSKDSITWLAVWNGYELRAMNKDQVALSGHTHDDRYLKLAGGTMNGNARIGHGSGNLYIGNSGNDGWIYTQDIASQSGTSKWSIRTSGAARFGTVYICSTSNNTYSTSVIECFEDNLYLNYHSSKGVSLCNGGGNVGIGTNSPAYKLDVKGDIRATGQIIREGYDSAWVNGRKGALLRETTSTGYHTLWSLKTTNGSWDFGENNGGSGWNNVPVLSYITDSNYNSGNNVATYLIKFPLASGTVALTSYGGEATHHIFLGYLNLYHGDDGTIDSYFYCLGYSVPFTYTRGGNYCKISIPDTTHQVFYIKAAIASVNYSGGGIDNWTGRHRGEGAWWLNCYASGNNDVKVKGFRNSNGHNDSWWGGNPLFSGSGSANIITVCLFGYVNFR